MALAGSLNATRVNLGTDSELDHDPGGFTAYLCRIRSLCYATLRWHVAEGVHRSSANTSGPPKIGGEVSWTVRTNFARILPEVCRDPNEFGPCQFPCRLGCPNFSGPWAPPTPAPLTPESPVTMQINLVSEGINLAGRYGDMFKSQHRK